MLEGWSGGGSGVLIFILVFGFWVFFFCFTSGEVSAVLFYEF